MRGLISISNVMEVTKMNMVKKRMRILVAIGDKDSAQAYANVISNHHATCSRVVWLKLWGNVDEAQQMAAREDISLADVPMGNKFHSVDWSV